jgi:hypothetical protein
LAETKVSREFAGVPVKEGVEVVDVELGLSNGATD